MTEPTRDALHAETLAMLEKMHRDNEAEVSFRRETGQPLRHWERETDLFAYAAACVRLVPELEAEVEEFRKQTAFYRVQAEEFWAEVERLREDAINWARSLGAGYGDDLRDYLNRPTPRTDG